jgi:low temperature requirement protein LtrA
VTRQIDQGLHGPASAALGCGRGPLEDHRFRSPDGILHGLLLLALLWWTWGGYTWLENQARADEGVVRAGMVVAMAAIFVVDLTIPEARQDAPGGLNGPLVLVCAYLVVRCVHLVVDSVAAADDAVLRRQVAMTWIRSWPAPACS